jgi:DNA-binding CsgD family transcriptional regulator
MGSVSVRARASERHGQQVFRRPFSLDRAVPSPPAGRWEEVRMDAASALETISARRVERMLMRARYLAAGFVAVMTLLFEPASVLAAVAVVGVLVGSNVLGHRSVPHLRDRAQARRMARWSLTVDAAAALATYLLFLRDPAAMPVALLAFVLFELALRAGWTLIGAGAAVFVAGLVARVYVQAEVLEAGPRPQLLVLWVAIALLLVSVGRELQLQEGRWRQASAARDRLAGDLRATVVQTLAVAGIEEDAATHQEVLAAVQALVEADGAARDRLIERVATVLAVPHHGLSPREQEILFLLARGYPDARIAAALFISPSTVRNHVQNMRAKLDLGSREELRDFASRYALPT